MNVSDADRNVLRELAGRQAEIAALPEQETRRERWRRLNSLERTRPLVYIDEIPWAELEAADPDLQPRCTDPFCQGLERALRRTLYRWDHLRCDMVVDGFLPLRHVHRNSGFGVEGQAVRHGDGTAGRGAADFVNVIKTDEDIDRIRFPEITPDWEATDRQYEVTAEILGDLLPVVKQGIVHQWCAPWDQLIQWYGIEELYVDMYDRPDFVNRAIGRMMDAFLHRLDQQEAKGLLDVGNNNHRVGSGGLGITDELPQPDYDGTHARPLDQWGTSTGQIFSEVSPDQHWEFCLRHELRWLERHGLNCYGCCEPLHNKMAILRRIPRLRRISMSTWIDVEKAAAELGAEYIFSYKPNPAVLAWDEWDAGAARADLEGVLEKTRGNVVELIMKDISTCRNDPARIEAWCALAVETAEQYAG